MEIRLIEINYSAASLISKWKSDSFLSKKLMKKKENINLKDAESALGQKGMDFLKSTDAFQRQLGQAYFNVQTALRKTLSDQNVNAPKLQQINKAFKQLLPVQEAVNASIARGGSFTPGQLLRGIKKTDKSKGKRKTETIRHAY